MVDLPAPDGPTKPIFSLAFILKLKFFNIGVLFSYEKVTFLNSMLPLKFPICLVPNCSFLNSFSSNIPDILLADKLNFLIISYIFSIQSAVHVI